MPALTSPGTYGTLAAVCSGSSRLKPIRLLGLSPMRGGPPGPRSGPNGPHVAVLLELVQVIDRWHVGDLTLMSGTGIPPGVTKNCKKGCVDNRVILVDRSGNIVWQYGQFGVTGFGPNQLNTPVQNTWLPNGNVFITDQGNERIIEFGARTMPSSGSTARTVSSATGPISSTTPMP